ncbi:MAG: hypothetical protein WCQ90_08785 [Deltaproteobacteria bacterium]
MKIIDRDRFKVFSVMVMMAFLAGACGGGGGSSAGQFDNARAGKAIMDSIKSDPVSFLKVSGKALDYAEREPSATPQQYQAFCKGSKEQQDGLVKLAEKDLLKIYSDQQSGCTYVSFNEKSTPFIKKQDKSMAVMLAKVEKVEVTDLGSGKQIRTVKYKAYYTPTPFGETLLKLENLVEEKEAGFSLSFDEGWRIN